MSIVFETSRDSRLLQQYYQLRQQCFRTELGLPDFDGSEEERDRQGQILIARRGARCLGGARIASSQITRQEAPGIDLSLEDCCMWERLVIDPAVRAAPLLKGFCNGLVETSRKTGFEHALVLSSLRNARLYRQCHTALGVGFQIHRQLPGYAKGRFAGLEHYLSVAQLQDSMPQQMAA